MDQNPIDEDELEAIEESGRLYDLARRATEAGDLESAECLYLESLAVEDHWKSHHMLAQVLLILGKADSADEHFRLGYINHPRNDKVATDYARRLFGRGDAAEAERILREVLARNDSYRPARRLLAGDG